MPFAKKLFRTVKEDRAFFVSLLCLSLIPLLSEFLAPFLAIGALLAAKQSASSNGNSLRIGSIGRILLLYMLYMALGILHSSHKLNSLSTLAMWAVMFCCCLSLSTIVTDVRRLRLAVIAVSLAAGLVGLIAMGQYVLRDLLKLPLPNQVWLKVDEWFYQYIPLSLDLHMADNRASSTFNNPNIFAEYLIMIIPLVGYSGFGGKRTRLRLIMRLMLLFAMLGTLVSFSRGAYLALLAILLLMIVTNLRQVTPFILCLIAGVSLIPEAVISRFMSIGNTADGSITERFETWDVAVQAILRNPLFGLGPGVSNFWEILSQAGLSTPHAHNLVLQLLVEGGFLALFLLCITAAKLLQNSLEMLNRVPEAHFLGTAFLAFGVSLVVFGMVDYPFLSPKLVGTFLMMIGFADASSTLYLQDNPVPLRNLAARLNLRHWWQNLPHRHHQN